MKATGPQKFATEADLVAEFCRWLKTQQGKPGWRVYHETGGWDLLLVQNETGIQVGLEAKLALNLHVLTQALPGSDWEREGPDYRGVVVPGYAVQGYVDDIAGRLGLGVIRVDFRPTYSWRGMDLPDESVGSAHGSTKWFPWLPIRRCQLPDYVPDVTGGKPAPLQLTFWKIRAIKLMILLDRRGYVTRSDMRHLGLSQSHWTQRGGWLTPRNGAFVRWERTPDFRREHPTSYAEIEADFAKWAPPAAPQQTALAVGGVPSP